MRRSVVIVTVSSCLFFAAPVTIPQESVPAIPEEPGTWRFAVLGDPQIGYGQGGLYGDYGRLKAVIDDINKRDIDLVVIPGDFVQDRARSQRWAFNLAIRNIDARILLAPGNHDVLDRESLRAFRKHYGEDYFFAEHKNASFIVINSETARSPNLSPGEYSDQWTWLRQVVQTQSRNTTNHKFFVMHRPPFVAAEDEVTTDENWPLESRTELLELVRILDARRVFAGHLHRSVDIKIGDRVSISVLAGTSRIFDRSPVGYAIVEISGGSVVQRFVEVADAPPVPFSVPGFPEWTPRLMDFSVGHWVFTVLFVVAAFMAKRTAQSRCLPRADKSTWLVISGLLLFLGVNEQLDFDELIREIGRHAAEVVNVYAVRHFITGGLLVLSLVAAIVVVGKRSFGVDRWHRLTASALLLIVAPMLWFFLSTISNSPIGMILDETSWDAVMFLSIVAVMYCSLRLRSRHGVGSMDGENPP